MTTEGLLLLTNDGAFAERVSHPRYEVPRVYHAKVHRMPDAETLGRLRRGVMVEGQRWPWIACACSKRRRTPGSK